MHALIEVIFPVFLVIGFGYAAVWAGFFSTESVDGLMRFTQNFAITDISDHSCRIVCVVFFKEYTPYVLYDAKDIRWGTLSARFEILAYV